ncbi:mitochondrial carrier domain-containing protein [Chytridium lagenaria]|nr:mitochondrial carrier domain-containing protein [Chytridium lagenaria]
MEDRYSFLFGAVGGICHVLVSHPFDLIKVRMQSGSFGYTSTLQASRKILAAEGWTGLYRGVLPVLAGAGPVIWVRVIMDFTPASHSQQASATHKDWKDSLSIWQVAAAGAIASIPTSLFLGPAERIKILLQVEKSVATEKIGLRAQTRESVKAMVRVWKAGGGIFGLYRGTGLTMLRDVPGDAAYFATFEVVKRFLNRAVEKAERDGGRPRDGGILNIVVILLSGGMGLAGCANWIVCIPIDSLKTQWQQSSPGSSFTHLLGRQTFFGLYRGLGPILLRAFPASGAFFLGVEQVLHFFERGPAAERRLYLLALICYIIYSQ